MPRAHCESDCCRNVSSSTDVDELGEERGEVASSRKRIRGNVDSDLSDDETDADDRDSGTSCARGGRAIGGGKEEAGQDLRRTPDELAEDDLG